ncbi:MAG: hypothetical protein AAFX87_25140 [Bacteroidota bacterium]
MKKYILFTFLLSTWLLNSCGSEVDCCVIPGVSIRIENASQFDFEDITINTSGGTNDYGDLKSGAQSDFEFYEFAYRYAYVELTIGNQQYKIIPIDYVGEERLANGFYTYVLDIADLDDQWGLTIQLQQD